ncbi:MAG: hypothetical protein ACT4QA_13465 [Panacagrimonas sp.]
MLAVIGKALLGALLGYVICALLGAVLLSLFSGNTHDRAQEVATTAIFFAGPLGALLGLVGGIVYALTRSGS